MENLQLSFSCPFDFSNFPFDTHECSLEYGSFIANSNRVLLNSSRISYGNKNTKIGDPPITIRDSVLPFEFELKPLSTFEKIYFNHPYSFTGMNITLKRKSLGRLFTGYYYPTTAFALLSMISFLINPDVVSSKMFGSTNP